MKKIILVVLVFMNTTYGNGQTHEIDSLKQLLQDAKTDTGRVLLLANLGFFYSFSQPDTAMLMSMQALEISRNIGFKKGEAKCLNSIGNVYTALGNYPKAMEFLLQALKINEKINNSYDKFSNIHNIGNLYYLQGDYRQSLDYCLQAKAFAEQTNDVSRLLLTFLVIGRDYFDLKILDSAMLFAQQANALANKAYVPRTIGGSLALMGNIHFVNGENVLALEYFRLGVPYFEKGDNKPGLSGAFLGMGKVFAKTGKTDSALFYSRKAITVLGKNGFQKQVHDVAIFLSSFYKENGNKDSTIFYMELAKTVNDSLFSQQKQQQFQSIAFDEKLRQLDIAVVESKAKEERKNNLQYAAIAVALITFIILFLLLSRSIVVKTKFIEFFGVLGLLAVFEFINLFIHPYLSHATNDSPVLMLLVLIGIGALLVPLHHRLEKWITKIMVEKNKKIRLDAAKKTIAQLEGERNE